MTRLFTDGAESGDLTRWTLGALCGVTNAKKRNGTYSYWIASYSTNYLTKDLPSTYTELYFRFAVLFESEASIGRLLTWVKGVDEGGSLRTKSFGGTATIEMYDGTALRETSSKFTMNIGEWHVFEVRVKIGAAPNGIFQVKFDGAPVLSWAGATNSQSEITRVVLYGATGNPSVWYDDIAINDTTGGADNSWCGDGGVLAALVPITGAAEYTDLIPSTGNAWDCVNEIPANADYVYESTVDKKSTYLLSDLAGLPSGASIARVWVELDALETAADGDKIATLLRSGATDAQGADQVLTLAYARYLSAEYLVDPAGGEDPTWTEARVNSLQAGAVVR